MTPKVGAWHLMRNGDKAFVLCDDAPGVWPVKGYVTDGEMLAWWTDGSRYQGRTNEHDLIDLVREPLRRWVRIEDTYTDKGSVHSDHWLDMQEMEGRWRVAETARLAMCRDAADAEKREAILREAVQEIVTGSNDEGEMFFIAEAALAKAAKI